jgi:DNA repair and recombination protein RAD52
VVNPQLDHTRRIGAPGSSSPLGNRGQFRPLTVKRPAGGDGPGNVPGGGGSFGGGVLGAGPVAGGGVAANTASNRVPLGDVSNAAAGGSVAGGGGNGGGVGEKRDLKRQRTS